MSCRRAQSAAIWIVSPDFSPISMSSDCRKPTPVPCARVSSTRPNTLPKRRISRTGATSPTAMWRALRHPRTDCSRASRRTRCATIPCPAAYPDVAHSGHDRRALCHGTQGRRGEAADARRTHRSARRAARQGCARRHAQGQLAERCDDRRGAACGAGGGAARGHPRPRLGLDPVVDQMMHTAPARSSRSSGPVAMAPAR